MDAQQKERFVLGEVPDVETLIGAVDEKRTKPHRCPPTGRCGHESHQRDPRVFLRDMRKPARWEHRHENSEWICYYCHPTDECRDAYNSIAGVGGAKYRVSDTQVG